METLSLGKYRRLQQCLTRFGGISVLALDHRNNLRQAINPSAPESVSAEQLSAFKKDVIRHLAPWASAVLLDPQFGAAQSIASGSLPGSTGLLVALEASGYSGDPSARHSRILPGFSVEKIKSMGASAVKFLAYYHPEAPTAGEIEELVKGIAAQCLAADMPFFLEPLSYTLDPQKRKLSSDEKRRVVVETARRLVVPGVDVLKAEFPLDIQAEPDEAVWRDACAELTHASRAPWVLLSASVDYETFLRQVTAACESGASGVAVGRAIWKESSTMPAGERGGFLREVGIPRMTRVTALVEAIARPVSAYYQPEQTDDSWYLNYRRE